MNDGDERGGAALRSPIVRRLLRLPVVLDDAGLGRLSGNRLLILEHRGRRSGRAHRTPLEVVAHDARRTEWTVIAAWRRHPDWLANIEAHPALAVSVAGRRHPHPRQRLLAPEERLDALAAYAAAHPLALRGLCRVFRWGDPRQSGTLRRLADEHVMVAFAAADAGPRTDATPTVG